MRIYCTAKEREHLIKCLSPENDGCIDCPVFDKCSQFVSCEEAIRKGIEWCNDEKEGG